MNLELPSDMEATLRQQAAAAGIDVKQLVISKLQEGLGKSEPTTDVMLPREQWKARFESVLANLPTRDVAGRVDCSRESIYGDRGR